MFSALLLRLVRLIVFVSRQLLFESASYVALSEYEKDVLTFLKLSGTYLYHILS
jgi:hypothetical protein